MMKANRKRWHQAPSLIDSKWLTFVRVAELGSLTQAARLLDSPQSMVSRHISQLERQCGARLFRRTGRGVVLTDVGAEMLPRVTGLQAQAEAIADAIRTSGGMPVGEARLGLLPSTVPVVACRLFELARTRLPQVAFHLSEGSSAQLEEHLMQGRLDMALLIREGPVGDSDEVLMAANKLRLVGRIGDRLVSKSTIPLRALDSIPLIVPSRPHPLRQRMDGLAEARGIKLVVAVEADSIRLQHEVVAAGGGYAITSGFFELQDDPRLASAQIVRPELLRSIVLCGSKRRPQTLATREAQRLAAEVLPELLRAFPV
jgi:LysR family transcriptional regulator, nitrogen assimilation regulatory protein